jgi:hypothetical protein
MPEGPYSGGTGFCMLLLLPQNIALVGIQERGPGGDSARRLCFERLDLRCDSLADRQLNHVVKHLPLLGSIRLLSTVLEIG